MDLARKTVDNKSRQWRPTAEINIVNGRNIRTRHGKGCFCHSLIKYLSYFFLRYYRVVICRDTDTFSKSHVCRYYLAIYIYIYTCDFNNGIVCIWFASRFTVKTKWKWKKKFISTLNILYYCLDSERSETFFQFYNNAII